MENINMVVNYKLKISNAVKEIVVKGETKMKIPTGKAALNEKNNVWSYENYDVIVNPMAVGKGDSILVSGRMVLKPWTDRDGNEVMGRTIWADEVVVEKKTAAQVQEHYVDNATQPMFDGDQPAVNF